MGFTSLRQILLATVIGAVTAFVWIVPQVAATEISYTRLPWEQLHVKRNRIVAKAAEVPLTSNQESWIDQLESCESGGDSTAINPKDLDGTPSYYSFQFKPSTFRSFGSSYKVIPRGLTHDELMEALKRRDLQRAIVAHMIQDPTVDWHQQFPACVQRYGLPPGVVELNTVV